MKTMFVANPRDELQGLRFRHSDFETSGWRVHRMIRYRTVGGKLSDWIGDPMFDSVVALIEPVTFGGFRHRLVMYDEGCINNLLFPSFEAARNRAVELLFGVDKCDPSDSSK